MTKPTKSPTKPAKAANQSKKKAVEAKKTVPSQEKKADWHDKYLRLYAEFDNYKKRIAKQQFAWVNMANERLIMALLPVLADFELAISADQKAKNKNQIEKKGIQIIYDKLFKALQQQGLSPMKITPGDNFDPDYHEALTTMPVKDDKLKAKIVEVVTKGYLLNKKVIQVAKVIIGK